MEGDNDKAVNGADLGNSLETELRKKVENALGLKDYAVSNGLDVPEDLLTRFAGLQRAARKGTLTEKPERIDQAIIDLSKITMPITIETMSGEEGESPGYRSFKRFLLCCGLLGVIIAILLAYLANGGKYGTILPQSGFAISLGFLGAVVYSFFIALRIIPRTFRVDDLYANYARLILGSVLAWLVYFMLLQDAFMAVFSPVDPPPADADPEKARILLFAPFLVGYSTTLALGILNKAITAVEITLGLEDHRNRLFTRSAQRRSMH